MKNIILAFALFAPLISFTQITIKQSEKRKSRADELTAFDAIDYLQKHAPHLLKFEVPLNVDTIIIHDTIKADDATWFFPAVVCDTIIVRDTIRDTIERLQIRGSGWRVGELNEILEREDFIPEDRSHSTRQSEADSQRLTIAPEVDQEAAETTKVAQKADDSEIVKSKRPTFDTNTMFRFAELLIIFTIFSLVVWNYFFKKE